MLMSGLFAKGHSFSLSLSPSLSLCGLHFNNEEMISPPEFRILLLFMKQVQSICICMSPKSSFDTPRATLLSLWLDVVTLWLSLLLLLIGRGTWLSLNLGEKNWFPRMRRRTRSWTWNIKLPHWACDWKSTSLAASGGLPILETALTTATS